MAKILVLDIETAPMKAAVWGMWQQNINVKMMEEAGYILCYSAKWLGNSKIMYDDGRTTNAPPKPKDEKRLLTTLIILLEYRLTKHPQPHSHEQSDLKIH